jgi:nucleoside-diphosphate-sugar epimerase
VCEALLDAGHQVVCIDNLLTGTRKNIEPLLRRPGFSYVEHDIIQPLPGDWDVQAVFNLASPASPIGYLSHPIETALVNSHGTLHMLELAARHNALFLQASTSEVYGDPQEHPQRESYWGNVNPHGIRACYDEGKRFAEALTMDFHRVRKLDARLIRIFNTYGPRSQPSDGRVVPEFVSRALRNEPLLIYGSGSITRSYCYVDDLVRGILLAQFSDGTNGQVYNLGNPDEFTLDELAALVLRLTGSSSEVQYQPAREDDPTRRRPDISRVKAALGWEPRVPLEDGLRKTIAWFREALGMQH